MNVPAENIMSMTMRSSSPRPPVEGKEVQRFHDSTYRFPEPFNGVKSHSVMDEKQACNTELYCRPSTPVSCAEAHVNTNNQAPTDAQENSQNTSPPPPYKWAQNLLCLLNDEKGVDLFQKFLKEEGQDEQCLSFWFACRGFKNKNPDDSECLHRLISAIYNKKVKCNQHLSLEIKNEIYRKISTNTDINPSIFDAAQKEIETYILKTTYPNFLRSDIYIQYLNGWKNETSTPEKKKSGSSTDSNHLPTVHEDSELKFPSNNFNVFQLTQSALLKRHLITEAAKRKPEGQAGYYLNSNTGPYANPHSKYSSFLPTSAQDSELQSLSSDAQSDDTMSLIDSNADYPLYNRSKEKRQQKVMKHYGHVNKSSFNPHNFIPRTQRLPESSVKLTEAEFHAQLVEKLNILLEQQKNKEKLEQLKSKEEPENYALKSENKSNSAGIFPPNFLSNEIMEENNQAILDMHVSRVWKDSAQHTPNLSPGCISPPFARIPSEIEKRGFSQNDPTCLPPNKFNPNNQSYVIPHMNIKHRRDHETRSNDSGTVLGFVSEENLSNNHRGQFASDSCAEPIQKRHSREQTKRYTTKKCSSLTDSNSSFVDSGVSLACDNVPLHTSEKISQWNYNTDLEKDCLRKNIATSPVVSISSKKVLMYNSTRPGSFDSSIQSWSLAAGHSLNQDPSLPMFACESTSRLVETRRKLEDEKAKFSRLKCGSRNRSPHDTGRIKMSSKTCDALEDGTSHRKQKKSFDSIASTLAANEMTRIGYCYGRHSVPYLSKFPGKNITLRDFKSLLSKKGNFRYFFKKASNDFGTGVVFEEITEDAEILPLWEGKVFCVIESVE